MPGTATAPTEGDATPSAAPTGGATASRRAAAVVLGLLLVFTAVLHVGHVLRYRKLSPVDELQHLDYLIGAPTGRIPGSGDKFGQEALRIETCSRLDEGFDAKVQPCVTDTSEVLAPEDFQEDGYNTAYIHPPTYYAVDGVLARVIDAVVPGEQSLLITGRLAAMAWALASVVFLWLLLAELRAGLVARASVIVLVVSAPMVLHAVATINPDGSAVPIGAAIVWAVLRWERGRLATWVPLLAVAVAGATKVTHLSAVGLAIVYLLAAAWARSRRDESWRGWGRRWGDLAREVRLAIGMVVVTAATAGLWFVAQRMLQVIPPDSVPMSVRTAYVEFPWAQIPAAWHQAVSPLQSPYLAPFLRTRPVTVMAGVVDLAMIAGPVIGTVLAAPWSRERRLGWTALAMAVLLGPVLVFFNALVPHVYVPIPPRYGLALVPALAAAAVPLLRRRAGTWVVAVIAVAAGGSALLAVAFPA